MDAPQQFDLSGNPLPWIAGLFVLLVLALGAFVHLRRRAVLRSPDFRTIMGLAEQLAFAHGHLQLHPEHFGFALSVDPKTRRALLRIGADVDKLRKAFERSLDSLPAAVEGYRDSVRPKPTFTPSTRKLLNGVAAHSTFGPRDWLRVAVVTPEIAPIMKRCGITMAKAITIPELDAPRPGDIVVHDAVTSPEEFEKLAGVFSDVLSMDPVEANAAVLAVYLRKKEWFTVSGDDARDTLIEAARQHGLTLRAERC